MLSEREHHQWAEIEQHLRCDPQLAALAALIAPSRRAGRRRVFEIAVTVVRGWWLLALVLALWCHVAAALAVAAGFTVVMALICWVAYQTSS